MAAVIAVALCGVFLSNFRAINSLDTTANEYTALALAATGTVDLDRYPVVVETGLARHYVQMVDGHARSSYPLVPPLIAAPVYRAAIVTGFIDPSNPRPDRVEALGTIVGSVLVALACACLYLTLAVWRPDAPNVAIALLTGLTTPLWSSASQALWSHAPAALLLSVGLALLLVVDERSRWRVRAVWVSGAAIGLAVACRYLLFVFPIGIAIGVWFSARRLRDAAAFVGGVAVAAAAVMAVNAHVFHTWLGGSASLYTAGVTLGTHGVANAWSGQWLEGLAGVLASPSRGMLIYMPVVIVAAIGAWGAWNEGDGLVRYGLVLATALYVVFWAKYAVWWGGQSYGPRFAADIAVPLALLSSWTVSRWQTRGALTRVAIATTVAWSVSVQAIGAVCYPAGAWDSHPLDVDLAHDRLWDWRDSQIVRTVSSGPYGYYKAKRLAAAATPVMMVETHATTPISESSDSIPSPAPASSIRSVATTTPPPDARPAPASGSSR